MPRSPRAHRPETARRRRDPAAARAAILQAAERHLVLAGPAGIRLQEVAADAGVSHPTILHHFGSREALVKAVISRAIGEIHTRLVSAIEASTGEEKQLAAILDGVFDALATDGRGRVMMWLALEGHRMDGDDVRLADVVAASHALRKTKRRGKGRAPTREDTAHIVVLAALALLGSVVIGPALLDNAGLGGDADAGARFRSWLARVLVERMDGP